VVAAGSMAEAMSEDALDFEGPSLVLGLGTSGVSAARFLHARGGQIRIADSRTKPPGLASVADIAADIVTGSLEPELLRDARRVVLSPGLSIDLPICRQARERGIEIINDIEIFARLCEVPVLAVTGSNGKSTVVTLLARMLEAVGLAAPAGGNLGRPALELLELPADVCVLEISSFQMEAAESLAPAAAAVLNVSADHLDRHPSLAGYAALKEKLLRNAAVAIVNADDPVVAAMGSRHRNCIEFSIATVLGKGYSIVGSADHRSIAIDGRAVLPLADIAMQGMHNIANALAALALARTQTDADEALFGELRSFAGLPHRCELVATIDGVRYINDSKATNPGATVAALAGLAGPIVLLAGGVGKGADLAALRGHATGRLRAAVVFGEAAEEIATALDGVCEVERAGNMPEAVAAARLQSQPGDTVLLSPACASLDMFTDYEARGRAFRDAVMSLHS
jgi:UDP-N-acetylmuramoylalanine--D-glutamate ligase